MQEGRWQTTVAGFALELAAVSCRGPRTENQDNVLVILPDPAGGGAAWRLADEAPRGAAVPGWPAHAARLAVMDGMGGHADGRAASEALAEALCAMAFHTSPVDMRAAVLEVHARLRRALPGPDERRGGSTLVVVDLDLATGQAVRLHVGDSRAYLWHRARAFRLTHDHSAAEFQWRDGRLSPEEYAAAARGSGGPLAQAVGFGSLGAFAGDGRSISPVLRIDLSQSLGDGAVNHADAARLRIGAGDRLLLATDGLLGSDEGGGLLEAVAEGEVDALARIVARSQASFHDNATGLLLALHPQVPDFRPAGVL